MILESTFDEFNSYPAVNFYKKDLNLTGKTITFSGLECLYPFTKDELIVIEHQNDLHDLTGLERQAIVQDKIKELQEEYEDGHKMYLTATNLHIYEYIFQHFCRFLIEEKRPLFKAPEEDVAYVSNLYSNLTTKKIVAVVGRNINKHLWQNYIFKSEIEYLVNNGYFVINLTMNPPGYSFGKDNYLEIPLQERKSYNRTLAYMQLSDYVLMPAGNGGVSTHLMTDTNVILFGRGGYVDNLKFGVDGEHIVSARQKYLTNNLTIRAENLSQLKNILKNLS